MDEKTRRLKLIWDAFDDALLNFVYYDRKEDDELGRDQIEDALAKDEITPDDFADYARNYFAKLIADN